MIYKELNPYFEIIGLLYSCNHFDLMTNDSWKHAALEHGIDSTALINKFGALQKKYVNAFKKNMSFVPGGDFDFFFGDEDPEFLYLFQIVCANHLEWFENDLQGVTEDTIVLAFTNELLEDKESTNILPTEQLIALLQSTRYSSNVCWKLMLLLQEPKKKISFLNSLIKQNIPAYNQAITAVQKPLNKLLSEFSSGNYLSKRIVEDVPITPTLIYPAIELIDSDAAYIGLFAKDIYKLIDKSKNTQKDILPILKALSDKSKFDILHSLLIAPKYNLELAEELDLTAATVSHHMNVLLSNKLVDIEKKDGRVYYTLSKETLTDLIKQISTIFLL